MNIGLYPYYINSTYYATHINSTHHVWFNICYEIYSDVGIIESKINTLSKSMTYSKRKGTNIKSSEKGACDLNYRKDIMFNWISGEKKNTPTEEALKYFLRGMQYMVEIWETH